MRVLHVNDHLSESGGVETYLLSLLPALAERGIDSHLAFGTGRDTLLPNAVRIAAIAQAGTDHDTTCARELRQLIDRLDPDVIHVHAVQNAAGLRTLAESGKAVLHGHDFRPICPASNFFFKRTRTICNARCGPMCFPTTAIRHCMTPRPRAAAYVYRRVRWNLANHSRYVAVVAPSDSAAKRYTHAGFDAERVEVIPYFCPLPPLDEPRSLPARPTITFIGRAAYNKGWECFIELLARLEPAVQGMMVGSFDAYAARRADRLARELGCRERLTIGAWADRSRIADIYARTTVFGFPSLWPETLGIVGIEAMSQGVPVAAFDVGGVRQWLLPGRTGEAVPAKDVAGLAEAVSGLLDPERNIAFGRNAIQVIRDRFLRDQHLERLIATYQRIATIPDRVGGAASG